jgi:hypothetical protein
MSFICNFMCKFFGACRDCKDNTSKIEEATAINNEDKDVAAVCEEMLEVVSKNIFITKSGKIVHEVNCEYDHGDGEWKLRSDGAEDLVPEADVIRMFNMVDVGKIYKVKYEIRLDKWNDQGCIENVISIDDKSLRD